MTSKARLNALSRIRSRNAKLPENERIKIIKGTSTNSLKTLERTLETKLDLRRAGISSKGITKTLKLRDRDLLTSLGLAVKAGNKTAIASSLNRLAVRNRSTLTDKAKQLNKVKGFKNIEFKVETLKQKKFSAKSKFIFADAKSVVNALTNEDYVEQTLETQIKLVNTRLQLQSIDTISFDEFDINFTIGQLNEVPIKTKALFLGRISPPKGDVSDPLDEETIDFSK